MPVVICTYLDSEDVPLVGRLDITRVRTDYRVQDIGTTLLVSKPLVNGSVSVTLAPGQYLFKAYGSNGKLRQSDKANVPDVDGTVYLASLVNSTPITEDEWDRSVEAVAIRLKADPEFIDLVSEGLAQDGVLSFNGRTGDIIPQSGDYMVSQIEGLPDALADINDIISDKADVTYMDTQLSGKEATGVATSLLTAHLSALNPHSQYALQSALDAIALALVGKENSGTAAGLMSIHLAALDPHPQYLLSTETLPWGQVSGKPDLLTTGSNITVGNITCNDVTGSMLSSNGYSLGLDFTILPQGGGLSNLQSWGGIWLGGLAGDTISGAKSEAGVGQYRACVFIKPSSPTIPLYGSSAVNATTLLVKQATWQNGLSQEWHDSAGVSRARMTHTGELEVSGLTVNGNIQASGNIIAGGFRVGTGATVTSILTATKTISSPSVTDTITVTGAQVGDHVLLSRGIGGFVSASNTVQFDSTGLSGVTVRATVLRVS